MALIGNYTKNVTGFTPVTANTYARIDSISGGKLGLNVSVTFLSADKTLLLDTKVYYFVPSVVVGSQNFLQQAYLHLKTLPDFTNYTDD